VATGFGFVGVMNFNRIDLNLFLVFEVIYAEGGITRASERLNLSQPAISHALGRLRELFDDPLFTRKGHVMTPTPFARRLIEPVREALRSLEMTLCQIDSFDNRRAKRRFTVGLREIVEAGLLPILTKKLEKSAPHVELSIVRAERRELENELSTGTLDLAVDVHLPVGEEIRRHKLCEERLVVVARRDHPCVSQTLDLETYLAQEHILVTQRRRGLSPEDYELNRQNLRRNIRMRCQSYLTACRAVAESDMLLTMAERWAPVVNSHLNNQLAPFPLDFTAYDSYVYWSRQSENDAANAWLRELVIDAFHEFESPSSAAFPPQQNVSATARKAEPPEVAVSGTAEASS
jgi:DNA-binding transcriptional LysR family regulator